MKWLLCLFLVWHIQDFYQIDDEWVSNNKDIRYTREMFKEADEQAMDFLNRNHNIVSAQIYKVHDEQSVHSVCELIYSVDTTRSTSNNKFPDGSWYLEWYPYYFTILKPQLKTMEDMK